MRKKISIIAAALCMLVAFSGTSYGNTPAEEPHFTITLDQANIEPGGTVNLQLAGWNLDDVYSFEVVLTYDPRLVEISKAQIEDALVKQGLSMDLMHRDNNRVVLVYTKTGDKTGESGDAPLARFEIKGLTAGLAQIKLESVETFNSFVSRRDTYSGNTVSLRIGAPAEGLLQPEVPQVPMGRPPQQVVELIIDGEDETIARTVSVDANGKHATTITLDQEALDERLAEVEAGVLIRVVLDSSQDSVTWELNDANLSSILEKAAVLQLHTDKGFYTLPVEHLNLAAVLEQLGTDATMEEIKLQLTIAESADEVGSALEALAADQSFYLVGAPVDFNVRLIYRNQIIEIDRFDGYVQRSIALPAGTGAARRTTAVAIEADGTIRHVPTIFSDIDGTSYASIHSKTNSNYAVIWNQVNFDDVVDHWSEATVNEMGSRLIINGVGNNRFQPDQLMTRAEFAAIAVRGLGLKPQQGTVQFSDVEADDWYAGVVITAYQHGLINGFEDGSFRPQEWITREEAMMIISRAMKLTGLAEGLPAFTATEVIAPYTDSTEVSVWAEEAAAASLTTGIVTGRSATELAPRENISRAEVATMIERLLQKSGLIEAI